MSLKSCNGGVWASVGRNIHVYAFMLEWRIVVYSYVAVFEFEWFGGIIRSVVLLLYVTVLSLLRCDFK